MLRVEEQRGSPQALLLALQRLPIELLAYCCACFQQCSFTRLRTTSPFTQSFHMRQGCPRGVKLTELFARIRLPKLQARVAALQEPLLGLGL